MTSARRQQRTKFHDGLIYAAFFASGMAGLIYEISWSRQIGLLFGHTVQASAIVVSGFFAGMGIGYALATLWIRRINPLIGYALAEWIAAAWACLIPLLLGVLEQPGWADILRHPVPAVQVALRASVCFGLLLPATIALGATLPFIAEYLSPTQRPAPKRITLAYALNTLGALLGVVMATAFLLVTLGVTRSNWLAAIISVGCGLAAYARVRRPLDLRGCPRDKRKKKSSRPAAPPSRLDASRFGWLGLVVLSGFGTLALQVLYTRMFALVLHNSTYTFGVVLAVFLGALALGATLVHRLGQRWGIARLAAWACMGGSVAVVLSLWLFGATTKLAYFSFGNSFVSHMAGVFGLVGLIVGPPIVLLGMVLPAAWQGAQRGDLSSGRVVGRLSAANTLAATLGSLAAAFVLMPMFGLWQSFVWMAGLFFVGGAACVVKRKAWIKLLCTGVLVLGLGGGAWLWMRNLSMQVPQSEARLLKRWESAYGWIDVVGVPEKNRYALRENLHYVHGDTASSTVREFRQGHLPLLLHGDPRRVLFLGLGTGMTAGAALAHPEVERIAAVELIPEVLEAVRFFDQANGHLLDDQRTQVHIDDARHWLLAGTDQFDVIVSDLFVPWQSQTGYLYTVEHYQAVKRHLAEQGIFCQWLSFNQVGQREFEMIANSFASVFPVTNLWWGRLTPQQSMVMLIGTEQPLLVDGSSLAMRLDQLNAQAGQPDPYLRNVQYMCRLYLGQWPEPAPSALLNTDEHPRVEFLTPLSYRGRNLLTYQTSLSYFDQGLSRLAATGIHFNVKAEDAETFQEKRSLQRQVLLRQMKTR
jgi:spermidine synthase